MSSAGEISKIKLPSGSEYDIKDATARSMIAGGITFVIAWGGSSTPVVGNIPKDVVVTYNSTNYTGTLVASADTIAKFYLVKSSTQLDQDVYDEYVTVQNGSAYAWEKLGDTIINLSDVVTNVTLNKQTTDFVTGYSNTSSKSFIGANSTFTVTQPVVSVTPSTTYLSASAADGAVSASGDNVTVVTGYASPDTDTFVKTLSVTDTQKLETTTIYGVQSSTTTASKATAADSQTTATGSGTWNNVTDTTWLKGCTVSNEVLTIGAATMGTQTTTQYTFADVTVPKKNSSNTTVATGSLGSTGGGGAVVTAVAIGSSGSAITDLGTASTDTVLGTSSTFSVTNPTISLKTNASTATGRVQVATGISSTSLTTDVGVAWNSKDNANAITSLGTPDKSAGLNNSTSITVSKGNP